MSEQLDRLTVDEQNLGRELTRRIELANGKLRAFAADEVPPTELRDEIESDLDTLWLWSRNYEECAFSGLCMVTETDTEVREKTDFVESETGFSDGFWVTRFGSRDRGFWAVGLGFEQPAMDFTEPNRRFVLNLKALHAVVPVAAVDDAFPEGLEFPTVHTVLSEASDELAELLDNNVFYTLDVNQQRHFIDTRIQMALDQCVDFGGLVDRYVEVGASRGFVASYDEQTGFRYDEAKLDDVVIKGSCESIVVLARWQISTGAPIRAAAELIDSRAGFFLAVCIDEDTAEECNLEKGERVFIPISGQHVEVIFDSEVSEKQV